MFLLISCQSCQWILFCSYLFQAVPLSARKASGTSTAAEGVSSFLQLPHFSETVVKKIGRKVYLHDCFLLKFHVVSTSVFVV